MYEHMCVSSMDSCMLATDPALHPSLASCLSILAGKWGLRSRSGPGTRCRIDIRPSAFQDQQAEPILTRMQCGGMKFFDLHVCLVQHDNKIYNALLAWMYAPSLDIPLAPSRRHLRSIHRVTLRQPRKTPVMLPTRGLNC